MGSNRRSGKERFVGLPLPMVESHQFGSLSPHAVKALIDIARKYNGHNNGNLALPWREAQERGWRSQSTLNAAKSELLEAGFIVKAKQGGLMRRATLYAITWRPIDETREKLEIAPTRTAPHTWKNAA